MAGPRFFLVSSASVGRSGIVTAGWPGSSAPIGELSTDGTWTAWRLVGSNNRELGRSARVFCGPQACVLDIAELQDRFDTAKPMLSADVDTGLWRWRLQIGLVTVAVSSRPYQRQRESLYSFAQFIAALPNGVTVWDPPASWASQPPLVAKPRGHELDDVQQIDLTVGVSPEQAYLSW